MLIGVTAQEFIDVVRSAVAGNLEALPAVQKGLDATRLGGTTDLSRRATAAASRVCGSLVVPV